MEKKVLLLIIVLSLAVVFSFPSQCPAWACLCGNGILQPRLGEVCDPGDPAAGIPPSDAACPGSCTAECKCPEEICWLTAGGVKFEPVTGMRMAQNENGNGNGPRDSVGGVVYPSCDPAPGEGGNWNHVFHKLRFHLKVTDITVLRCGNVLGIDPGTESPVCPYNFIEFVGTGTLVGIGGNTDEAIDVNIFARAEDRNEPGNDNANPNEGANVDRYLLEVFNASTGASLLKVSDAAGNPLTITGGNFQIHCSSCSN